MKISKHILATTLVLPLMLGSFSALANGHKGDKKHDNMFGMKSLFKGVELTKDQKGKMDDLRKKNREEKKKSAKKDKKEMMAQANKMHKDMQKLVLSDKFNEKQARELAVKMSEKQVDSRLDRMRQQHELFSLLTQEQKEQVMANMNKNHEKMKDKMHKMKDKMKHDKGEKPHKNTKDIKDHEEESEE